METLHPGLYLQEVQGTPPIEGVSTSTGAFLGLAPRGKIGEAVFITSWAQYVREFGSFTEDSYLAYAVKGFFENGGKRCYVVRVSHYDKGQKTSSEAVTYLKTTTGSTTKVISKVVAKTDGAWGNKIAIEVKEGTEKDKFTLVVYFNGSIVEEFEDLTNDSVEDEIKSSAYVNYAVVDSTVVPAKQDKVSLLDGKDGSDGVTDSDYIGDSATKNGLHALDNVKVNLVSIPSITSTAVLKGLITYVEGRQDCVAVLDSPRGCSPSEVDTFVKKTANLASEYSAIYYPWLAVNDPIGVGKSPVKLVPPSGHVMGVMARIDGRIGCWKAPAGTDAQVQGIVKLEYEVSDNEQDLLNPDCINCIRSFEGDGTIVWGARTLSKGEYKYLPVRRTAIFVEQSLLSNLRWTVFRPNNGILWNASKMAVDEFLGGLWSQGGLKGSSSKEAFFSVCDGSLNTKEVVDSGKMLVDLGICPLKPAEFVVLRLSLKR